VRTTEESCEKVWCGSMDALFPLTPALSAGEREKRSLSFGENETARLFDALQSFHGGMRGSLSPGERVRVRGNEAHPSKKHGRPRRGLTRPALALTDRRSRHRTTVIRKRMRRALLQRSPNRPSNGFLFVAQPGVPESKHLDAARFQPHIAFRVLRLPLRRAVLRAVQFDIQQGFQAKEVKNMRSERMLPTEFAFGKTAVPQPGPHEFFGPGVVFSQHACDARDPGRSHAGRVGSCPASSQAHWFAERPFPLTPALSPGERETRIPRLAKPEDPLTSGGKSAESVILGLFVTRLGAERGDSVGDRLRFSLSPGERAGVRGNGATGPQSMPQTSPVGARL